MRIFAIGDMHLPGGTGKTMDRFGENWHGHDEKIFAACQRNIRSGDLLLIAGDTTWAMRLDDAIPDLRRIGGMPGRKLMLKGNHDYWWDTLAKLRRAVDPSIDFLHGSSVVVDRVAIAGTRGWTCPNDSFFESSDQRIYEREVGRLGAALRSLPEKGKEFDHLIVALHYPPSNDRHDPSGFTDLIEQYEADICVYGHLHGESIGGALAGLRNRTEYVLVSADAVQFTPAELLPNRRSQE